MSANGTPGEGETNEDADEEQEPRVKTLAGVGSGVEKTGEAIASAGQSIQNADEAVRNFAEKWTGQRSLAKATAVAAAAPVVFTASWTKDRLVNGYNRTVARAELAGATGYDAIAARNRAKAQALGQIAVSKREEASEEASSIRQAKEAQADAEVDSTDEYAEEVLTEVADKFDRVDLDDFDDEEIESMVDLLSDDVVLNFTDEEAQAIREEGAEEAAAIVEEADEEAQEIEERARARSERADRAGDKRDDLEERAKSRHPTMSTDTAEAAGVATTSEGTTAAPGAPSGESESEEYDSVTEQVEAEGSQAAPETAEDGNSLFGNFRERLGGADEGAESETEEDTEEDETQAETTDGANSLFD